jgi:hypothetical protein
MVHNLRFMVEGLVLDDAPDVRHWLLLHFERVVVAQHRGGEGERVLARCRLLHTAHTGRAACKVEGFRI